MFVLSKLVAALVSPLGSVLALGLIALILTVIGKTRSGVAAGVVALIWLWAWSLPISSSLLMTKLEADHPKTDIQKLSDAGAVVVLGGGILPAARLADYPNLESGADRIWHAARIYHAGKTGLVVLSGGNSGSTNKSEAQAMQLFLLDLGVQREDMLLEEGSRNTTENARNTAALLRERKISEIVLITSAYHMSRAKALFEAQGLIVIAAATDYEGAPMLSWRRWIPSTEALDVSSKAFKEIVARRAGR